jgi:hypothetical protein
MLPIFGILFLTSGCDSTKLFAFIGFLLGLAAIRMILGAMPSKIPQTVVPV